MEPFEQKRNTRARPSRAGLILLDLAGVLIVSGGLYDMFTPSLPPHELAFIRGAGGGAGSAEAVTLSRELLRALGGALISAGAVSTSPVFYVLACCRAKCRRRLVLLGRSGLEKNDTRRITGARGRVAPVVGPSAARYLAVFSLTSSNQFSTMTSWGKSSESSTVRIITNRRSSGLISNAARRPS